MAHEHKILGLKIYSEIAKRFSGLTELPRSCVIVKGDRVVIVGAPNADVQQLAISELGMTRAHVFRHPEGEGLPGLLVNLVA